MKKLLICVLLMIGIVPGISAQTMTFGKLPKKSELAIRPHSHSGNVRKAVSAPLTDPITDPKGEIVYYRKESAGTFILGSQLGMYKDEFPAIIVWGSDNTVYFKNLLSAFPAECYLKGTVDGNKITVAANQTIEYYESEGYGINFGVFKTEIGEENGQEVYQFKYAPEIESIEYKMDENGALEMVLPGKPFDGETPTEYVAAFYFTDDYSFTGYCDFYQKFVKEDIQFVTIPEGLTVQPYAYVDEYNYASLVEVARDEKYLYIRGLNSMLPEGTLKAKIEGNKAVISQNEYLGIYYDQYYITTKVLYDNPDYDPDAMDQDEQPFIMAPPLVGFELTIDDENKIIYADTEGVYLSFHCDDTDVFNSLGFYGIFELRYQDSYEGTPSNPVDLEYTTEFGMIQGFNDFFFTLSNFSTEGKVLDKDYLYYKVFVDGEALVFCQETGLNLVNQEVVMYAGVPFEVELMPYDFANYEDVYKWSENIFDIGIYLDGLTTIGVQTVYNYNNNRTYSDIVTLDIESGDITVTPSGVESITDNAVETVEYYRFDGLKVNRPEKGLYIKVERRADGSVKTGKVVL